MEKEYSLNSLVFANFPECFEKIFRSVKYKKIVVQKGLLSEKKEYGGIEGFKELSKKDFPIIPIVSAPYDKTIIKKKARRIIIIIIGKLDDVSLSVKEYLIVIAVVFFPYRLSIANFRILRNRNNGRAVK